jgi:hypothetical protein
MRSTHLFALALCVLGLAAVLTPHVAGAASDFKIFTPAGCEAYGATTMPGELTYNQLGITNPGTTNETVICSLPVDSEVMWNGDTPKASVFVFYRSGAVPGKVACTAFVGNSAMAPGTVATVSGNPANLPANTRDDFQLDLLDNSGSWGVGAPTTLICTLTPKATLGGFTFNEFVVTQS